MKKLLLSLVASASLLTANAGITVPTVYKSDFGGSDPLAGWTFYAPEGKAGGTYGNQFFFNYSPSDPVRILSASDYAMWSLSQYREPVGQLSDTWMISPEIEINFDSGVVGYTVQVIGMTSTQSSNYYVYVSEGGTNKEDFKELDSGSILGSSSGSDYVRATAKRVKLEGYNGKKIRLAFVNKGNQYGLLGFSGINVGAWYIDQVPSNYFFDGMIFTKGEMNDLLFTFKCSTPESAKSYTLDLVTSGGFTYNTQVTKSLRLNALSTINILIQNIPLSQNFEEYTLTFTPDYEGAFPLVCKGYFVNANRNFEPVGVMEDATGTWCGWCPFGIAALEYYQNAYNGLNGNKKAIGIGLHMQDNFQISDRISDYPEGFYEQFFSQTGGSYPFVVVNRAYQTTPSPSPIVVGEALDLIFNQKSYGSAKINKVYYNPTESSKVWVDYSVITGIYNTQYCPVTASVIVLENNVQGTGTSDNQITYLATQNYNESWVTRNLGEAWVPYFEPFFGVSEVLYNKIQYQDVARGAFPSYAGLQTAPISEGENYNSVISFEMPNTVKDASNTRIVLLLINKGTGEIITADELKYDDYTFTSKVETIESNNSVCTASLENGNLNVYSNENGNVEVYGIDGSVLLNMPVASGLNTYNVNSLGKVLIVKVNGATQTNTFKFIAK